MTEKLPVPERIAENHWLCDACNGWREIWHFSEFDKETRLMWQHIAGDTDCWVIHCEECDNLEFVK